MTPDPKRLRDARAPLITAILAAIGLMAIGHEASTADVTGGTRAGRGAKRPLAHVVHCEAVAGPCVPDTAAAAGAHAEPAMRASF